MRRRGAVMRGWAAFAALWLAACGGEAGSVGGAPADAADPARQAEASAAPAQSPPPRGAAAAQAPVPTAADSAAGAREDLSPEWKMNERNMAPYADCMAKANAAPEHARARLQAACGNLRDAPK